MEEIFTIGYAGYDSAPAMIDVLQTHAVTCLIDVRSTPYSRYHKEFDRERLMWFLRERRILYRNYAKEFGARQMGFIGKDGAVDLVSFAESTEFLNGITKIENGMQLGYVFCLMCAEKDPMDCHRGIVIGKALKEKGFCVRHIIPPDTMENQEEMELRAVGAQVSMFEEGNPVEAFYVRQAKKIAARINEEP